MNTLFRIDLLLPIALLFVQAAVLLFIFIWVLQKLKILRTPYAGMEYSQIIVAAAFLFGVFFIATADTSGLFQTFKTLQNAGQKTSGGFTKFSQFFLVILFFEAMFAIISFFIINILLGLKETAKEIEEGNIPASILLSVIILGFAIVLQVCAKEMIEYITPHYINIR
jgi:type III secretory pathway component EscS